MTVQVIPVRTTGPAQTEWTDLTAAAQQDLMEPCVKKVTVAKLLYFSSYFRVFDLLYIPPYYFMPIMGPYY